MSVNQPFTLRQTLKKQLFYAYIINDLQAHKKAKNRVKQRLFHGNAMRPKGGYFAQGERKNA
ncbi:hypothetical protein [Methylotuvimicrobium sp. KM2]|uniref:hypothetical protein n=1 Tax=Methylotuvimicrobium sp. KM2 TaxID=3133976 RepID=UPI0031011E93